MQQHFIIEGRYLGSAVRGMDLTRGSLPDSILLYCECCGEVYAKFPIEGRPFIGYRLLCRKCVSPFRSILPGSIWLSWDPETMERLPLAVLQWEFQRELDQFDKDTQ